MRKSEILNLIPLELIEAAMERQMSALIMNPAPGIIGVDPGWPIYKDRTAAVWRRGVEARVLFWIQGQDTVRVAEMVARCATALDSDMIFVDQAGAGAGVRDLLSRGGFPVTGVSFMQPPMAPNRFPNRYTEMWWSVREWLRNKVVIDRNLDLYVDLIRAKYHLDGNGKIRLVTTDDARRRGSPSPDLGDALALTFADTVLPRHAPAVAQTVVEYNAYDWMERSNGECQKF